MQLAFKIEATPNERRRLLGGADITPMVELVSDMLDDVMMVVVEARLAALSGQDADPTAIDRGREDAPASGAARATL